MRRAVSALALVAALAAPGPALADHAPTYVMPTMRGVPVVIDRQDASWAVIEGDWGLHRPGHGSRSIIHAVPVLIRPPQGAYYPSTGRAPRLGRYEIEPPSDRRLPRPAETYFRSWSAQSSGGAVTVYPPYELPQVGIERRVRRRH
jgi:hypothetical protein